MKSKKKKVLSVFFSGSFESYTRYSGIVDEELKKKVLGAFNGRFLSNLVEGYHILFNFFKGGYLEKGLGNPAVEKSQTKNWLCPGLI